MKGKKDKMIKEVFSFPFKNKYNDSIRKNAKSGSVSPEKIITIFKGEAARKITLRYEFSLTNFFATRYANTIVSEVINELKILIPGNPNWEKGELNKTKAGLAQ
jgi:hypothetical protein